MAVAGYMEPISPFLWGAGGRKLTPEEIAAERAKAEAMMAGGVDTSPVGHWLEGLARVANAGVGALRNHRANKAERENAAWEGDTFQGVLESLTRGMGGTPAGGASDPASPAGPLKGAIGTPDGPKLAEVESYIRQAAEKRGIDPNIAVRVARSEGLANGVWQSNVVNRGKRETSYGPFQLLVGGGLGDKFQRIYGKSPADPSTLWNQIDFALDEAATGGWSPWYGAAKVGVGRRTGLEKARALGYQPTARTDERTTGAPPVQVASLDPTAGMSSIQPLAVDLPSAGPIPAPRPEMTASAAQPDIQQQIAQSLLASDPMAQTAPMQAPALPAGPTTQAPSMPMPGASPMPMMQPGQYSMGMVPPAGASQMVPPVSSVPASLNGLPDAAPIPTSRDDVMRQIATTLAAQPQPAPTTEQQIAQILLSQGASAPRLNIDARVIEALTDPRAGAQLRQLGGTVLQHQLGQHQTAQKQYAEQRQAAAALAQRQQIARQIGVDPILAADPEAWEAIIGQRFGKDQSLVNAGDGRLYDPNNGQWIIAPGQSGFRQATQEEAAAYGVTAGQFGPDGRFYPVNPPQGMTIESDGQGGFRMVQGAGAGSGQKLTESQGKDIGFYTRGIDADAQLADLDTFLTDWSQENAGKLPLGIGNYLREPRFRQAKQAADSFLTALLRKDTGAAITANEFEIYGPMFLPVPGDDQNTIQQKRRARQVALLALRSGLGTADAIAEANRIALGLPETELPSMLGASISQAASDALKADPSLADQFDQKYGAGSAARILGR